MQLVDLLSATEAEAARQLSICNACRYCESYCAVFPALQRRTDFGAADIRQLANLCHNCKSCYYACQYSPPHSFAVNLPAALSEARAGSYEVYAWPQPLARLFYRNGLVVSLASALAVALTLIGVAYAKGLPSLFTVHRGPGSFYLSIPWSLLAGPSTATLLFSTLALAVGGVRFWRDRPSGLRRSGLRPTVEALGDVLTLRNLGGGAAEGCNDLDIAYSKGRRRLHHALFYGFLLCFASTTSAWFMDRFLGELAPYPWLSAPVLLGTVGGLGLLVGSAGLLHMLLIAEQGPTVRRLQGGSAAILALLFLTAATGLLLLFTRETAAMTLLLAVHFGLVLAFFLLLPYSKMVHGIYRSLALLRDRQEQAAAP